VLDSNENSEEEESSWKKKDVKRKEMAKRLKEKEDR